MTQELTGELNFPADLDDPFAALDREVAAVLAAKEAEASLKAAAKQARDRADDPESRRLEAELDRIRNARLWKATSNVALFRVKNCECGTSHAVLERLFERQENKQLLASRLIVPEGSLRDDLPRLTDRIEEAVLQCASCIGTYGFDLSDIFAEVEGEDGEEVASTDETAPALDTLTDDELAERIYALDSETFALLEEQDRRRLAQKLEVSQSFLQAHLNTTEGDFHHV